ncbi:MAG: hypothetical protein WA021_03675 [Minisyncoccia bacterium]
MKKILTLVLVFSVMGPFSFAQETETPDIGIDEVQEIVTETSATAPEVASVESVTEPVIQATYNTQDATTGDTIENTENPETATTTESEIVATIPNVPNASSSESVLGTATSTAEEATDEAETVEENIVIPGPASLEVVEESIAEEVTEEPAVETMYVEELQAVETVAVVPEPEFMFMLTGKNIPTRKKPAIPGLSVSGDIVSTNINPIVDNDEGSMILSGACSEAYYVVLLFKEADDYETDPRSYVLNKAYSCLNGLYTYSLEEVPEALPDGTYYLMVGSQGERGMWTPITSLTEVTIRRNPEHEL